VALRIALNLASAADRFGGGTGTFVDGLLDGLARRRDVELLVVASASAAGRGAWDRAHASWTQEIVDAPAAASFGFAAIGDAAPIDALVRRRAIDVWFTPHTLPAPPVLPCPTVSAILDVQHEDLPELYTPRERARRALVYETIARTCTRVVTLSTFSRDRIAARYAVDAARIDIVPPGVPAWALAPDLPRAGVEQVATPYVLYPATTWRHKNHGMLIEAIALLRAQGVDLDLRLTGLEGEAHGDVVAALRRPELAGHVQWLGHVDPVRLRALYDGAMMVAVPSRYEGFGLPVVEAMARGVPVVAADAASLPAVAGGAALLVPPLDAGAWAGALRRLASDPPLRARLAAAGRERAAAFTAQAASAALIDSLERAVAEGPRGERGPRPVAPDRSFTHGCRYLLQAPAAATLEVAGTVLEAEEWTMRWNVSGDGRAGDRGGASGRGRWTRSIVIPSGPASVALDIDAGQGVAHLDRLLLSLADGTELDLLPSLDAGGPEETVDEALARAELRLRALAPTGFRRVALYGAGEHSRRLIALAQGGPCRIVAVIDDAPSHVRFAGVPLVTPGDWASLDADALAISSRGAEATLAARARAWLPPHVPIVCFYTAEGRS
jgi:glycosyltransferase involved in cell wall biosynthesis